eukprot:CAMPEP_0173160696 /NCGR_PEP_ID=MMETSP1105-20130129/18055_1 /TAXON_ID=2985 /ORGANISM="Ochromonas sp., Strain BG-1" /LENGTH=227 /DNA_ID=CAMNT_0014079763 /DNA_START=2196 /DNA_END=2880 /DNA_ORIENTATION=-
MSIYTIMKLCRNIIRMKQNDEMLFTLTSSRLIIQDLEIDEKEKDGAKAKEKVEDDDIEEVMMQKMLEVVNILGLQDLTIDIASFGCLGYLLLIHSLQYCDGLSLLVIHEKGFFSSNPLTSSDNEVGVIREDVIELRRASLLGFAFNKLGNHMTLKEIRYHGIWEEGFLYQMIEILRDSSKYRNLQKLSFSVRKKNIPLTEEMIKVSKGRAYLLHGKGISIAIDVTDD